MAEGHDACREAGMQCEHGECPWWAGVEPLAINTFVYAERPFASTALPERKRPMLKAGQRSMRRKRSQSS
jgi:hypothetical protein